MKVAVLSPIAWRTPPQNYGPWEKVASVITEGLVQKGHEVTLFATGNSETAGTLDAVCPLPYSENSTLDPKVWECLHISNLMEKAAGFDIIHNHYDFLPLSYSKLINTPILTTIHGFSSSKILPVYQKYNTHTYYVSISNSDRDPSLDYERTIYHGIDAELFTFNDKKEDYLLYYGRIHPEKGTLEAIEIAEKAGYPLKIAGLVQDRHYFEKEIIPRIDGRKVNYLGNLDQKEGNNLLGHAKALLHPINFEEPFGLSVAEAMMCGTPVIANNRGSMPELIVDGYTGFLVSSIAGAVNSLANIECISPTNCRNHAMTNYNIETMVGAYIEVYECILARRVS